MPVRLIRLMHLNNRSLYFGFILINIMIPIFFLFFDIPSLLSIHNVLIIGMLNTVLNSALPLILLLELLLFHQIFGKHLNGCIDIALREIHKGARAIYRDTLLITTIVMILCLYQLSHLILRYNASPPTTIPYSGILKSELFHYKRFESNVYEGIIWYFTRAPASMASSHPVIDDRDSAKKFNQAQLAPEYYLCDASRIAFINSGGFRDKEPYAGFALEFGGKNCTYVASFLEKRGYKTIIETPRYSINQFPQE
jgi:hypothetical protein